MNDLHKFRRRKKLAPQGHFLYGQKVPKEPPEGGCSYLPLPPATHPQRPKEGASPFFWKSTPSDGQLSNCGRGVRRIPLRGMACEARHLIFYSGMSKTPISTGLAVSF